MVKIQKRKKNDSNLEQKITSIPDKTKGKFKIIKGILTEIKSNQNEKELKKNLGPGKYNIYPKWETTSVMWSKGLKKEEKSKINESKIQKELEQNYFRNIRVKSKHLQIHY